MTGEVGQADGDRLSAHPAHYTAVAVIASFVHDRVAAR